MDGKLTKDKLQALLSTMYSRPLDSSEVMLILENTTEIQLTYHSTFGGLDLVDYSQPAHSAVLVSFSGRGVLDTFKSADLLSVIAASDRNASILYELFAEGRLTVEKGNITKELYSQNYHTQKMNKLNRKTA